MIGPSDEEAIIQQMSSLDMEEDFSTEDAFRVQMESAAAAGWDDPALDIYNELEPEMP